MVQALEFARWSSFLPFLAHCHKQLNFAKACLLPVHHLNKSTSIISIFTCQIGNLHSKHNQCNFFWQCRIIVASILVPFALVSIWNPKRNAYLISRDLCPGICMEVESRQQIWSFWTTRGSHNRCLGGGGMFKCTSKATMWPLSSDSIENTFFWDFVVVLPSFAFEESDIHNKSTSAGTDVQLSALLQRSEATVDEDPTMIVSPHQSYTIFKMVISSCNRPTSILDADVSHRDPSAATAGPTLSSQAYLMLLWIARWQMCVMRLLEEKIYRRFVSFVW